MRFEVGPVSELPPGSRKIVSPARGTTIGVFNIHGRFYALKNRCPHMGAPLCEGLLTGTSRHRVSREGRLEIEWIREGEILACPWHHWEFDVVTGATVFPSRNRVATYDVSVAEAPRDHEFIETYPVVVADAKVYLELRSGPSEATSA
jgi:nitrite reductase (NADH) small subunit